MNSKQVVVWIDHKEARIFPIEPGESAAVTITAPSHFIHHKHPLGPEGAKAHPDDAKRFFHEVTRSLEGVGQVLIVGPSTAKTPFSFLSFLSFFDFFSLAPPSQRRRRRCPPAPWGPPPSARRSPRAWS